MSTVKLSGRYDDGTPVTVLKIIEQISGYSINKLPNYKLETGEDLTPLDDDLRRFEVIGSGRIVTLAS